MSQLEVTRIVKSFGGNRVLPGVSFELRGRSLALVGPNGAGKTTLLNILSGALRPDSGSVRFEGREVAGLRAWKVARLGMVKTHQIVRPLRTLTVDEHLALFARTEEPSELARLRQSVGLEEFAGHPAQDLPFGALKRLELAEALAIGPRLLLLDEPIGGLSRAEAEGILSTLGTLREAGRTMVIVEHRLREILPFVDTVIALDRGEIIFDGPPAQFYASDAVKRAYLGGPHVGS
jgi:ABC-type branched-subunit amino acid transport system ATPase component